MPPWLVSNYQCEWGLEIFVHLNQESKHFVNQSGKTIWIHLTLISFGFLACILAFFSQCWWSTFPLSVNKVWDPHKKSMWRDLSDWHRFRIGQPIR
jgi:hypothetical protein